MTFFHMILVCAQAVLLGVAIAFGPDWLVWFVAFCLGANAACLFVSVAIESK